METLTDKLDLVHVQCCVCETDDAEPVAVWGKILNTILSSDTFLAMKV